MQNELFSSALGVSNPWFIKEVSLDQPKHILTIQIDFETGSRFAVNKAEGCHPVYDTKVKRYRHL